MDCVCGLVNEDQLEASTQSILSLNPERIFVVAVGFRITTGIRVSQVTLVPKGHPSSILPLPKHAHTRLTHLPTYYPYHNIAIHMKLICILRTNRFPVLSMTPRMSMGRCV